MILMLGGDGHFFGQMGGGRRSGNSENMIFRWLYGGKGWRERKKIRRKRGCRGHVGARDENVEDGEREESRG